MTPIGPDHLPRRRQQPWEDRARVLTVWLGSARYTFNCGEVSVGRHRDCDIWLRDADPVVRQWVSRRHALLQLDGPQWKVVDLSRYGIFVDGVRHSLFVIRDRQTVTLGGPNGPKLTFGIGTDDAASIPCTLPALIRIPASLSRHTSAHAASTTPLTRPQHHPRLPEVGGVGDTVGMPTSIAPVVQGTVGRAVTNELVIDDAYVSRVHAMLIRTGTGLEIRDLNSANGTCVNGVSITQARLREGDNVTIGNTDLVVSGNHLVPWRRPIR
ncbi:FHA domain-containing protein [Mycobacterium asiaticum]|uniref:FHA domain-containing protein n=1 Tax=Mycobacterium asiaticum TaxID=1790 RepID=UPI0015606A64|nr:FHA domain-containing protein [Mycobacterium asiaticum]